MKRIFLLVGCTAAGWAMALGIAIVGSNGTGTSVVPSTAYLDANGDDSIAWASVKNGPSHYQDIDDECRPTGCTPPTGGDDNKVYDYANENVDDVYTMENAPSGSLSVTQVKVWVYGYVWPDCDIYVDLYIAGGWEGTTNLSYTDYAAAWKSATFSGSWDDADVDAMKVKLSKVSGGGTYAYVYEMCAEITYTE